MLDQLLRDWLAAQAAYREPSTADPHHARDRAVAEEQRRDAADTALYHALKRAADAETVNEPDAPPTR